MVQGWMIYVAAAIFFSALGFMLDRNIVREFGKRRVMGGIVLQNVAALFCLLFIGSFFGIPPKADINLVIWTDAGVIAALIASALYMKSLASPRKMVWQLGALMFTTAAALIWHDCAAIADPITIFWLAESAFFGASVAMLIVYPRALGNIKLALKSPRGTIIPLELLRGLGGHAAWLMFMFACAFAAHPYFLFR